MAYVIGGIWCILDLAVCYLINRGFLPTKPQTGKRVLLALLLLLFTCLYTNVVRNLYLKLSVTLTVFTLLSALLLEGPITVHVCLAVVSYIFMAAMDAVAVHSVCYLLGISSDTLVWRKIPYTILVTAEKSLGVILAWSFCRYRKKGELGKQRNSWIVLSSLFPMASVIMLTALVCIAPQGKDSSLTIAVAAAILMVANVAMLYVIGNIEKATRQEQDNRLLRQQISIQAENYAALKSSYGVQRKSTHEFEHHLQVLRGLLERKEYGAAQNYVRQLQADRALKVFSITTNNPVVDVVLNQKYQAAQEHGIKMHVKVNDLSAVSVKTNELAVLLSNLLDNAIEACVKLDGKREILCSIVKEDGIYLSVRNTSAPVQILQGEIATTKEDTAEHGYGLPAVKYILNRLQAEYTFAYRDGWFQFVAEIPESNS